MSGRTKDYVNLIQESEAHLTHLLRNKGQSVRSKDRLTFLLLLKTGTCRTQAAAGAQIGIKTRQSQILWALYEREGLAGLLSNRYKGGNHRHLDADQDAALLAYLDQDKCITQAQIIAYVRQTFQVQYTASGMSRKLKRLKVKAKTGRPVNIRKDEEGEKAFKKNLQR